MSDAYSNNQKFADASRELAEVGRGFYVRGWLLGTSGNLSAVVNREPLRLAITSSGVDKGTLNADHMLLIDERGGLLEGNGRPSAETLLHLAVVRQRGAGAVLHTHSVWSNILSDAYGAEGRLKIEGYEMLKGLDGISTHEHEEALPIIDNSQEMSTLSRVVEQRLIEFPQAHGFILRRHGMYTWGRDISEAKRHVEILEFLFEVCGRKHLASI
jgi:methylthioribulose-1-phosphate dehydratase